MKQRRGSNAVENARAWLARGNHAAAWLMFCTVLVAVLGVTLHPRLLLLLPALFVLLLAGTAWPWLTIRFVRGRLAFARDRIHEHEEVRATLTLRNHVPWPAWGLLLDLDMNQRLFVEAPRPWSSTSETVALRPVQRGPLPRRVAWLKTGFPFGLIEARRSVTVERPLVVWPQVFHVDVPPDFANHSTVAGAVDTRRVGTSGDTIGVREFRRGDPMRWIHWRQTARHGRFMVREFQATGIPRVRIVLDCDPAAHVGQGADSSFEWAVRIAASLSAEWLAAGAEVELIAGDVRIPAAGGRAQVRAVLDALAEARLQDAPNSATNSGELATVFICTDLGLGRQPEASGFAFMLSNQGFGGNVDVEIAADGTVIAIAGPDDVPKVLSRTERELANVA